jgi:hypothetical protein
MPAVGTAQAGTAGELGGVWLWRQKCVPRVAARLPLPIPIPPQPVTAMAAATSRLQTAGLNLGLNTQLAAAAAVRNPLAAVRNPLVAVSDAAPAPRVQCVSAVGLR